MCLVCLIWCNRFDCIKVFDATPTRPARAVRLAPSPPSDRRVAWPQAHALHGQLTRERHGALLEMQVRFPCKSTCKVNLPSEWRFSSSASFWSLPLNACVSLQARADKFRHEKVDTPPPS